MKLIIQNTIIYYSYFGTVYIFKYNTSTTGTNRFIMYKRRHIFMKKNKLVQSTLNLL